MHSALSLMLRDRKTLDIPLIAMIVIAETDI